MKSTPFLIALALSLGNLWAEDITMKATKLSLFKAGYGYISLEGTLKESTSPQLHPIPIPIAGGFWIRGEEGVQIEQVVSSMIERKQPTVLSSYNLLKANEGKLVRLRFSSSNDDDVRELTGTILPIPARHKDKNHHTISPIAGEEERSHSGYGSLLIQSEGGPVRSIMIDNIEEIFFHQDIVMPTETSSVPGVKLQLHAPAAGKKIQVDCLSSELSWLPSYCLTLGKDGKAQLEAKATILNGVIDLDKVQLELVSGTPSPLDTKKVDPMALIPEERRAQLYGKQSLFITENRINMPIFQAQHVNSNFVGNNYNGHGSWPVQQESGVTSGQREGEASPTGTDTGELFYYPITSFSMKAGDVVTRPLFKAALDYKKIYTWKVGDPLQFERDAQNKTPEDLWSCVRFSNPLDMPLTAAPIEIIDETRFAGMNTLLYTAKGAQSTIQMSRALSIDVDKKSTITESNKLLGGFKSRARTANTALVTLELHNKMTEPIEMEVTQYVTGEILSIGQGGTSTSTPIPYAQNNKLQNTIQWVLKIPAGGKQKLEFTYKYIN